ncbi:hypothetical protein ATY77_00330 [Rhizobium sp. R634]|nr:hypothetical protein ATY76_05705 [Rhizobium sp. R339]OWV81736.1 hypothetical protein ATY77_00330 [Rhizobium sp. R634]
MAIADMPSGIRFHRGVEQSFSNGWGNIFGEPGSGINIQSGGCEQFGQCVEMLPPLSQHIGAGDRKIDNRFQRANDPAGRSPDLARRRIAFDDLRRQGKLGAIADRVLGSDLPVAVYLLHAAVTRKIAKTAPAICEEGESHFNQNLSVN